MKSIFRDWHWLVLLLWIALGGYYCLSLPQFVQGGDTGELVADAYRLFVPHPPGYPFWVWIQHFWIRIFPFGTVFWKASLLNAIFAFALLGCLAYPLRKEPFKVLLCIPVIALSTAFSESAVLPDVFALHELITVLIGVLYLFGRPESLTRQIGIPLLFGLGTAHHHTIIFLLPVYLATLYEARKLPGSLKKFLVASAIGGLGSMGLYSSLFLLQPNHAFSWGNLSDLSSLINHILRAEYGTFQLAPTTAQISGHGSFLYFLTTSLVELAGLLIFSYWFFFKNRCKIQSGKVQIWSLTILFSMLFLLNLNVVPEAMGAEILRRFHGMPMVQVGLLCIYFISKIQLKEREKWIGALVIIPIAFVLESQSFDLLKLRNDSTFHDYASNLLMSASQFKPAIVLIQNDNAYFGARYVQSVLGDYTDVPAVEPNLRFRPWYVKKIKSLLPHFQNSNPDQTDESFHLDLEEDIILPNLKNGVSVIVTRGFQDGQKYHTTYLGLGRKVDLGTGISFDQLSPSRLKIQTRFEHPPIGPQANSKGDLYAQYSFYEVGRALEAFNRKDLKGAYDAWNQALIQVPYAFPALVDLCRLTQGKDIRCSTENFERAKRESQGLF
jgi:hypothetical protein